MLTEFLTTGEYPQPEPPNAPAQYAGKSLQELLTPATRQEQIINGTAYIRLGQLCVESRIFEDFSASCKNIAVGNETFVFNRIATHDAWGT